jgi:hypothetical protein
MNSILVPSLGAALLLSGCVIATRTGPVQYDSVHIEPDRSELVRVNLQMGAGDLKVGSGTSKLMQAYFTYNVPAWKPEVRYSPGNLTVSQPGESHTHAGNLKYEWDLRFGRQTPLDINVNFGAGEAQLDLGALDLRNVTVQMGVGKMEMDLRGTPAHNYNVHIQGGIGEAVVHLPADAGVYATANGGIGEIRVHGLRKDGDHWVNDAHDRAKVQIRVDVQGGIGAITLYGADE